MRPSIFSREPHEEHTEEQCDRLQRVEQQAHRLPDHPPDKDQEWNDKERDLDGAANGDGKCEIDLVAVGDDHSGDMLSGVANDGKENETKPFRGDGAALKERDEYKCTYAYKNTEGLPCQFRKANP
jgi:hypothetical protein